MKFHLHDYLNAKGENEFKKWVQDLQKHEQGKLREKLDKLMQHGDDLHPHMLSDTPVPGIKKIRVQGPVKLRPLLCNGPIEVHSEYTLLLGAKEVGDRWLPKGAPSIANENKKEVILDPSRRRRKHE